MTFNQLASEISISEGKAHQAKLADVREILSIVCVKLAKNPLLASVLIYYGVKKMLRGKL